MNRYRKIIGIVIVLILISSFIFNNFFSKTLINDYYTYINVNILDEYEIKDGEIGWSKFSIAQEKVDEEVNLIVKDLINS